MVRPRLGYATLLLLFPAKAALAQPEVGEAALRTVSLPEALAEARVGQPRVKAAFARLEAERAAAGIPRAAWLPRFGATAQLLAATANQTTASYVSPATLDLPRIGGTRATATGSFQPYPSTLVGIGGTQELFDFGRIAADAAAYDAQVDVERQRAASTMLAVTFDVEEAYFAVFAAKSIVRASGDAYERARVHRDLAKAGVGSGMRPPIELTRAEAELARLDIGRIRARAGLETAQAVLAAVVGAKEPALDALDTPPAPVALPSLDEGLRHAASHDPGVLAARAALAAQEAESRAIGAQLRPDLQLTAALSGRAGGAPPSGNGTPADANGWLPNVPNWDVGVVLSVPLFDGTVDARQRAARARERARQAEIAVALQEQSAVVREAFLAVRVALSALPGLERSQQAARANYEQADARFRAGLGTSVELADAEAVRTDAEIQLALGTFEVARARAAFGRAIAEGL
jgi:outer membrane protein